MLAYVPFTKYKKLYLIKLPKQYSLVRNEIAINYKNTKNRKVG